jgi:O-antigen/teichoic acid export membrane protein
MFDTQQKATGTGYTTTVAFLVVAFIFSPAALMFSGHYGYISVSLAIVCSVICVALAWVYWKKSSRLSIPSIAIPEARAK